MRPSPKLALVIALISCSVSNAPEEDAAWPALRAPNDYDPSPGTLRIDLRAKADEVDLGDGVRRMVYRYVDGSSPARGGVGLTPILIDLEVGDRLVADFHNDLPIATLTDPLRSADPIALCS